MRTLSDSFSGVRIFFEVYFEDFHFSNIPKKFAMIIQCRYVLRKNKKIEIILIPTKTAEFQVGVAKIPILLKAFFKGQICIAYDTETRTFDS